MTEKVDMNCKACFYSEVDKVSGKFFCTNPNSGKLDTFVDWYDKCIGYKENVPAFLRQRGIIK